MYAVELARSAAKFFENADVPLQRRLDRCFDLLRKNPRGSNNAKPLHGAFAGFWRYRVGDYRVLFQVDDDKELVRVASIVHRREAYD